MLVEVVYQAPVYVTVDTATGKVVSVVVDDEACLPDTAASTTETKTGMRVTESVAAKARAIASRKQWPAWRTGA
jgi:hypothetical protein